MPFQHSIIGPSLLDRVTGKTRRHIHGIHGLAHWERVEAHGLHLAACHEGDPVVVSLFALLHDACRENEDYDPQHGPRAARWARALHREGQLPIDGTQLRQLTEACRDHTQKTHTKDPTLACCWDADRLDLPRVGILPHPKYLNTLTAKEIANKIRNQPKKL